MNLVCAGYREGQKKGCLEQNAIWTSIQNAQQGNNQWHGDSKAKWLWIKC